MTGLEFVLFLRYRQSHPSCKQLLDFPLELVSKPALRAQAFQEVVPHANCGSADGDGERGRQWWRAGPGKLSAPFWGFWGRRKKGRPNIASKPFAHGRSSSYFCFRPRRRGWWDLLFDTSKSVDHTENRCTIPIEVVETFCRDPDGYKEAVKSLQKVR